MLDLGSGTGAFAVLLHRAGHEVFGLDRAVDRVAGLADRLGTRLHVAGQVESLPFLSCHFDVVTAAATLHRFAPGLALTEIARVLRPGGRFAVAYNTRDDTVPWVRRLSDLLQQADPNAMRGDFGADSVIPVADSRTSSTWSAGTSVQLGSDHPTAAAGDGRAPPRRTRPRAVGPRGAAG